MADLGAIVSAIVSYGLGLMSRPRLAKTSGTLSLAGLSAPVEVIRDRWGVPHIYATNTPDLMFAQGFVHAQDRLWQMDFQRRLVWGRLAEVLGEAALPADRWLRVLGMRRVAEYEAAELQGEVRTNFQSFAAGVNAFITQGSLPIEFALLRYRPEPWTPADSLTWTKMLAWSLSVNWESELLRSHLIARLGPERAAQLEPDCSGLGPCIMLPGLDYAGLGIAAEEWLAAARPTVGPPAHDGLGSNAWVIAGSRTASGRPILANDLHQLMNTPSLWYENHLEGGDLQVTGCSFPGVPGVIAGHNADLAWGISNGFADVQDLYVERLRRSAGGRIQFQFQDEWFDARVIRETIRVRGRHPVVEDTVITRHGPIINRLAPDLAGEQPLALCWTSQDPETMALAYHLMNRARNCDEFHDALRCFTISNQNIVYADRAGNIGYTYAGRLPLRARGDGRVPVPGWTGEYEWTGYVPFDELPHLINPPQGYVATANNRVVDSSYPYHVSCDFCSGDRAQRISELIEAQPRIDAPDVVRMQLDQVSPGARLLAHYIGGLETADPELAAVVEFMRRWDGDVGVASAAACVHQVFGLRLLRLVLARPLGDLVDRYLGRGANPVLADASLLGFRAWEWLQLLLADPHSPWFDLGAGEGRDEVVLRALRDTVAELKGSLGADPQGWAWGRLHTLTYQHTLSSFRPLAPFYNRGPYPIGGDFTTVCATGCTQHQEQHNGAVIGPNYRFVADLGDWSASSSLLVPGQSGQPGSPHYDDQIDAWFSGDSHPMPFARADVERHREATLHLVP